jgi:hypothetical protein
MSSVIKTYGAGGSVIADTTLTNGSWREIVVIAPAQFHTLTGNVAGAANTTIGSAVTFPANHVLRGTFSALKLHGGSVVAYAG